MRTSAQRVQTRAMAGGLRTRQRLLIVGCGDVGHRVLARLWPRIEAGRLAVVAVTRNRDHQAAARLRGARALAADLDDRRSLDRLAGFAAKVLYLAPPPTTGLDDPRLGRFIAACTPVLARAAIPASKRWVLISTSGVYGDRGGAETTEAQPPRPSSTRALRRAAAETRMRCAVRRGLVRAAILRVPGIYADDRLPMARLRRGDPVLVREQDGFTNLIHADDLANIAWLALHRGRPGRVVNAVDDSHLRMGEWFDLVADARGLPRPPRKTREQLAERIAPAMLSFLDESRRLSNRRMKEELRVRLRWPTAHDALTATAGRGTSAG